MGAYDGVPWRSHRELARLTGCGLRLGAVKVLPQAFKAHWQAGTVHTGTFSMHRSCHSLLRCTHVFLCLRFSPTNDFGLVHFRGARLSAVVVWSSRHPNAQNTDLQLARGARSLFGPPS